jgi:hypothetical protein
VPSEWKINECKLLRNTGNVYRSFKRGTEIPERKVLPPYVFTFRLKYFSRFSEQERLDIFKTLWFLGDTNAHVILSLNATIKKIRKSLKLFQNMLLKSYFDSQ